jgi:hypothetical protein
MMDRTLKAHNNAIKAYDQTDKELSLVDFSGCSEAYKRAFKRKWNRLDTYYNRFKFLERIK